MHNLNIFNGGFRPKATDLNTLQNAYREGLKSIFKAFGGNYIIYGCEVVVSGSNYNISDGSICVDGEYYLVPAHTTPIISGNIYFWEIITQNLNSVVYADSTSHHSLTERYIQLNSSASPSVGYIPQVIPTMMEMIDGKWKIIEPVNILSYFSIDSVTCATIFSSAIEHPRQNRLWYRIVGKRLEMSASIYVSMTSTTISNITECEIIFPESVIAHPNATVIAQGLNGFLGGGFQQPSYITLNDTNTGLRIVWDTPTSIPSTLFVRIPHIEIMLQ